MKKTMFFAVSVILMATLCLSIFAASGSFVESPSKNATPEVVSVEPAEYQDKLVITAYKDRATLSDSDKANFESEYKSINDSASVAALAQGFTSPTGYTLAVSDIFYVSITTGATVASKAPAVLSTSAAVGSAALANIMTIAASSATTLTITLKCDTLTDYVGLLNYCDSQWTVVKDAKVNDDGNLVFTTTTDKLEAFAIVVNTKVTPPDTGEDYSWIYFTAMAILSVAIVVFVAIYVVNRKKAK